MQNKDKWLKKQVLEYEKQSSVEGWNKSEAWNRMEMHLESSRNLERVHRLRRRLRLAVAVIVGLMMIGGGLFLYMRGTISLLNQQLYTQNKGLESLHQDLAKSDQKMKEMSAQMQAMESQLPRVVERVKWKTKIKTDTIVKLKRVTLVDTIRVEVPVSEDYWVQHEKADETHEVIDKADTKVKERYTFELNSNKQSDKKKKIIIEKLLSAQKSTGRFTVLNK